MINTSCTYLSLEQSIYLCISWKFRINFKKALRRITLNHFTASFHHKSYNISEKCVTSWSGTKLSTIHFKCNTVSKVPYDKTYCFSRDDVRVWLTDHCIKKNISKTIHTYLCVNHRMSDNTVILVIIFFYLQFNFSLFPLFDHLSIIYSVKHSFTS